MYEETSDFIFFNSGNSSTSFDTKRGVKVNIFQSKKKYYKKIKSLLTRSGYYKSEYTTKTCESFNINKDLFRDLSIRVGFYGVDKHNFNWSNVVLSMNVKCREAYLKAFIEAKGYKKGLGCDLSQNKGVLLDSIELCAFLLGYKTTKSLNHLSTKNYSLRINNYTNITSGQKLKKLKKGLKNVFCLETVNSNFVIRQKGHITITGNCTYGAGGTKLALTLDIDESEGHSIVKAYRDKNWAINAIADETRTKECLGSLWLFNPVSKFWYSLRHKKDKFSTLNQGTGVFCFDLWIKNFRKIRPQITGQMHDEVILHIKKGHRDSCTKLLKNAIRRTNEQLQLNRELDIDVQFGNNYAEIH